MSDRHRYTPRGAIAALVSILLAVVSTASAQGGVTPQLVVDMKVFADPTDSSKGWVTTGLNVPLYGNATNTLPAPLPWALNHTGPAPLLGTRIKLTSGVYAPLVFDAFSSNPTHVDMLGGTPTNPVRVYGETGTIIGPNNTGGSSTMAVRGKVPGHTFNHITWTNTTWLGANAGAAIHIGACQDANNGIAYSNWKFVKCEMDGGFDHKSGSGFNSKWGMRAYSLDNFVWRGGSVHDVKQEHGFYLSSMRGPCRIQGVTMYELGRTAIQIVARVNVYSCLNMPENVHDILIFSNHIADVGLQPGDYHAGTAITLTGRQNGTTSIIGNLVEFGLDTFTPGLRAAILAKPDYPVSKPYGSGAINHWTDDKSNHLWSNELVMEDNVITYEANSGDRHAVVLSGLEKAICQDNTIQMGARTRAIVLGNFANPGDPEHPLPATYCVSGNTLIPGGAGAAVIQVEGLCGNCSQPVSAVCPCP